MHFRTPPLAEALTAVMIGLVISPWNGVASAQEEASAQDDQDTAIVTSGSSETATLDPELNRLIEDLGANSFAVRERAANQLMEKGPEILAPLRQASLQTSDPEIRLRTDQLVQRMTAGDLQIRIDAFLSGEEVEFDGWMQTQGFMGDSSGVREMFVELMLEHPEITKSLAGSSRERFVAMAAGMGRVQNKMFVRLEVPSRADVIAMLLPANDPNVPVNQDFESLMISLLRKEAANNLHRDVQLGGPVDALVSGWINRSSLNNRAEILFFAMSWDLSQSLPLARRTIVDATSVETIAIALQMISRFGDRADAALVAERLDDTRVVSERGFARGEKQTTQIGDVAMATIALIHGVALADIGFKRAQRHPTFSFMFDDLGFSSEEPEKGVTRKQVRERVDALLQNNVHAQEAVEPS